MASQLIRPKEEVSLPIARRDENYMSEQPLRSELSLNPADATGHISYICRSKCNWLSGEDAFLQLVQPKVLHSVEEKEKFEVIVISKK